MRLSIGRINILFSLFHQEKEAIRVYTRYRRPVIPQKLTEVISRGFKAIQATFACSFQLSLDTIEGSEQGKRKPDAAAANYLRMIQADPEYVQRTLAA